MPSSLADPADGAQRLGAAPVRRRTLAARVPSPPVARAMTIPPCVHFCWIGTTLPWAYVFAVLSAAERSGFAEVKLHHTDTLDDGPQLRALTSAPGVHVSRIDPLACLAEAGALLQVGDELAALYCSVTSPVTRADILRAGILFLQGGIYLDMDTITVADLHPLLATTIFVGSEFIVWPPAVRASRSLGIWALHLSLDLTRKALRWAPGGWQVFRRVERLYCRGVNNAVMGAQARSPLLGAYLRSMLALPKERRAQAYALGPHLLQDVISRNRPGGLTTHDPCVFYPLAPEISEHWFRFGRAVRVEAVLSAETRVVHWYASVRTKSRVAQIDPSYVQRHRHDQLYSNLVCSCVPGLAHLT